MGEVTDILEFWGLFSTWVSIHFVRFYVMFYHLGLTLEGCFRCPATMRRTPRYEFATYQGLPFCDQKGSEKVSLLRGSGPRLRGLRGCEQGATVERGETGERAMFAPAGRITARAGLRSKLAAIVLAAKRSPLRTPKVWSSSKKAKKCRSAAFFLTLFRSSPD